MSKGIGKETEKRMVLAMNGFAVPPKTYHEFLINEKIAPFVSSLNPAAQVKNWTEGRDLAMVTWEMFLSDPKNHIHIERSPVEYLDQLASGESLIKLLFNIVESDNDIHLTEKVIFGSNVAPRLARGTLVPVITSSIVKDVVRNTFHHQGFTLDYYTKDFKEGIVDRDQKMKMLLWNMVRTYLASAVNTFLVTPHSYVHAFQKNAAFTVPKTPMALFLMEQQTHGIMNKSPDALFTLVNDSNNTFAQIDPALRTRYVIMSFADSFYAQKKNELMVRADASGNAGVKAAHTIQVQRRFEDFETLTVPFIETELQDELNRTFTRPFATGSNVNFKHTAYKMIENYETRMRDVEYADVRSGHMNRYTLLQHLESLAEFNKHGLVDYDLMNRFRNDNMIAGQDWLTRTGVRFEGNENRLSAYLRAVDRDEYSKFLSVVKADDIKNQVNDKWGYDRGDTEAIAGDVANYFSGDGTSGRIQCNWVPHYVFGDIPEEQCRDDYMDHISRNVFHVLDKNSMGGGIGDMFGMISPSNDVDKFRQLLGIDYTGDYESVVKDVKKIDLVLAASFIPDYNSSISTLHRRLERAQRLYRNADFRMFTGVCANLLSRVTLDNIRARAMHNVQIPLGGMNVRFRETQNMHSIFTVAESPNNPGKLGTFYQGRRDIKGTFDATRKLYSFTLEYSHGVRISNPDHFYCHRRVRGGRYIGGSDNYYADMQAIKSNGFYYPNFIKQMLRRGSNVPLATSYNQSVEGAHMPSFDVRGEFHKEDMIGKIDGTSWMNSNQDLPQADGLCMLNFLLKFNENDRRELDGLDLTNLNFLQEAYIGETNFIVRQLNSLHYDSRTDGKIMTDSHHLWGYLVDNVYEFVTSHSNVLISGEDNNPRAKRQKIEHLVN